jgi:UDP-N-acetylglucosamine acyltransferase
MSSIHPTAIIEDGVSLGADVSVGPFCVVKAGAKLGDGCRLEPHAMVYGCVELGPRVHVHSHAVLGDTPQDLAFEPGTVSHVIVGEGTVLREGVTIHQGTKAGSVTRVGKNCLLMAYTHVAHNVQIADHVITVNGTLLAGYAEVADRAFLSGNCVVHQFCRIGRLAMISGCGGISKDLPPFFVVHAATANLVSGLNIVGLRRAGVGAEARLALKKAFHLLYLSGLNTTQALEQMAPLRATPEVNEVATFIEQSKRGIVAYRAGGEE